MMQLIEKGWKSLGPGFIMASVVLGPGSIAVASSTGSEFGYTYLWVILLAAICMALFVNIAVRFGVRNQGSFLLEIRRNYSPWLSTAIGVLSFLSAASFQFGNNIGIGIGMEAITGLRQEIWPVVFTILGFMLLFFFKNLYALLEKLMMVMVMIMILAFVLNIFLVAPEPSQVFSGFIPELSDLKHLDNVGALIASTLTLNGALYQSYIMQQKEVKVSQLESAIRESYVGIFFLWGITSLVIMTSAASLFPLKIEVQSAADMAIQLGSLFGSKAKVIFSLGLCAAAFSSLMVNAVIGGGLLSDALGKGSKMNEKVPRIFTALILIIGMVISVFYKGNVVYALIVAQVATLLAIPLMAGSLLLVGNHPRLMKNKTNTMPQNILAAVALVLICGIMWFIGERMWNLL